jgi:hypothetical protein
MRVPRFGSATLGGLVWSAIWLQTGCSSQGKGSLDVPPSFQSKVLLVPDRKSQGQATAKAPGFKASSPSRSPLW